MIRKCYCLFIILILSNFTLDVLRHIVFRILKDEKDFKNIFIVDEYVFKNDIINLIKLMHKNHE